MPIKKINIKKEEEIIPFSRGILAKSLMSTGINYIKAYEISEEIKNDLYKNKQYLITSEELRAIIYSLLEHKYDRSIAEKFYTWEMFQKKNIPLVLLLGGSPGVNKTKVALNIANRLNILNTISTDTIRSIMRKVISEDLLPELHARSYFAWETLMNLPKDKKEKIIAGFKEHVRHVSIGVGGAIERSFEIKTCSIFYGVHLTPNIKKNLKSNVFHAIFYIKDKQTHKKIFFNRFKELKPEYEKFEQSRTIHNYILNRARINKINVYENSNPNKTSTNIIEDILEFSKKHI